MCSQISLNPQKYRQYPPNQHRHPPIRRRITAQHTTAQKRGKPSKFGDERPCATKAKILAMKEAQGLSESEVVVNLVHKALQIDGDVQYGAMLRPVIQDQIHKDIQSYSNRNASINFQALYAAEQSRLLSIHILRFLTDLIDVYEEFLPTITACQENAWKNITKMTSDMPAAPPQRKETNREWQS